MTRPASDDTGHGAPGRARRRVESLNEAREVVTLDENAWAVRWPMSTHWQMWTRFPQDRHLAELVADDLPDAAAAQELRSKRAA